MAILKGSKQIPLYYRLKQEIIEKIQSGEYKPNQKLPTESEFCEQYSISRAPVRQALAELAGENYIYTIRGKGSFVLSGYVTAKGDKLQSFSNEIREMGFEPGAEFISCQILKPDVEIAKCLGINDSEDVLEAVRLRLISGEIYSLNYSYFPIVRFPRIWDINFDSISLDEEYRRVLGVKMVFAKVTMGATATTAEMSELLQLPVGSPLLKMERTTYFRINQDEKPMEFCRVYFIPEKYKFEINLYNK